MRRRGYFKHFNDASQGESIGSLLHEKRYFAVCVFWAILERCNQKGSGQITESWSYFERVLNVSRPKLNRTLAELRLKLDCISFESQSDFIQISVSNYAEYQENRGKKKSKTDGKNQERKRPIKDNRLKIKDILPIIPQPDPKAVVDLWNGECGPFPKVLVLNDQRRKAISNLPTKHFSALQDFSTLFAKAKASPFLTGKNDRGWRADFDFVIRRWAKILEGAYAHGDKEKITAQGEIGLFTR